MHWHRTSKIWPSLKFINCEDERVKMARAANMQCDTMSFNNSNWSTHVRCPPIDKVNNWFFPSASLSHLHLWDSPEQKTNSQVEQIKTVQISPFIFKTPLRSFLKFHYGFKCLKGSRWWSIIWNRTEMPYWCDLIHSKSVSRAQKHIELWARREDKEAKNQYGGWDFTRLLSGWRDSSDKGSYLEGGYGMCNGWEVRIAISIFFKQASNKAYSLHYWGLWGFLTKMNYCKNGSIYPVLA